MSALRDLFRSDASRVDKVIVAIDVADSTAMKEQQSEAAWLTTYGWLYDLIQDTTAAHHGRVVKFLGDGAMLVWEPDCAQDAINWAIQVQEALADAQAENRVSCPCAVGIAFGVVREFESPTGGHDFVGSTVDRAFRLCSAAAPQAIFVDADAVAAAAMNKVKSRFGTSLSVRRTIKDYRGSEEQIKLKGFSSPQPYHEILWAELRFGAKPSFVSALSGEPARSVAVPPARPPRPLPNWTLGQVVSFTGEYGFILSGTEEFWFSPAFLFDASAVIDVGKVVWFVPADPFNGAPKRRATDVLPLGHQVEGEVDNVLGVFGFAVCMTQKGEPCTIYLNLGTGGAWQRGDRVRFTVGKNRRGPAGDQVSPLEPRPNGA